MSMLKMLQKGENSISSNKKKPVWSVSQEYTKGLIFNSHMNHGFTLTNIAHHRCWDKKFCMAEKTAPYDKNKEMQTFTQMGQMSRYRTRGKMVGKITICHKYRPYEKLHRQNGHCS